jgi:hypothetical protein
LGAEAETSSWTANDVVPATSPVSCLGKAGEQSFNLIVICFWTHTLKERGALVELCAVLKGNRHTAETPVFWVLPTKHPQLLHLLGEIWVEYTSIASKGASLQIELEALLRDPNDNLRLTGLLSQHCSYINYVPIDSRREIGCCKANRDLLVLVPFLLMHLCEVTVHGGCEYFMNPKENTLIRRRWHVSPYQICY